MAKYRVTIRVGNMETIYEFYADSALDAEKVAWRYWMHDHAKTKKIEDDG